MDSTVEPKQGTPEHLLALATRCLDIPRRYTTEGNVSHTDLVTKIGYHTWRKQITRTVLEAAFRACPEKMAEWLQWSEDQRWSPTWCITDDGSTAIVSYIAPDSWWRNRKRKYTDRPKAFAAFVKHILDGIARNIERDARWHKRS